MIRRSEPTRSSNSARKRKLRTKRNRRLMMEGLEQRQMLAGDLPMISLNQIPTYDGPRNVGTVLATKVQEQESPMLMGMNDDIRSAQFVRLGNGPGQSATIDLSGMLSFGPLGPVGYASDVDYYAFDLQKGDILDISTHGAAASYTVFYDTGRVWYGVDEPEALYPLSSPLQTSGNATFAQVIPESGRYYLEVVATNSQQAYTIGLRTYRPVTEQLPVGTSQTIFLDFDGGSFTPDTFNLATDAPGIPLGGRIVIPTLQESLIDFGIEVANDAAYQRLVRTVINQFEEIFRSVADNGVNGDYAMTGKPGDYGIKILNSEDHPDPGNHPLVSRIIVGGTAADYGFETVGIANSVDIGNFDLSEVAILQTDGVATLLEVAEISPAVAPLDLVARAISAVAAHEAGHLFGMRHTDGENLVGTLNDEGGSVNSALYTLGVGPDGIFGTVDDIKPQFLNDRFSRVEGLLGYSRFQEQISLVLSTGTRGGTAISGKVFNDLNRDGRDVNEPGLAGVTIFVDVNNNGTLDANETRTVSAADGTFSLAAAAGSVVVRAIAPGQFVATTPISQTVNNQASGLKFGFNKVQADITGTKFVDLNGNGVRDQGEPGIGGVYIYIDLDGDNRPDLGEPSAVTAADGSYSLNFPGPGTYTIREVTAPGFVQTFPGAAAGFEHTVSYNGLTLTDNYNFGNVPTLDYGDAPDSYRTTAAAGGPSHGIIPGLMLGSFVDRDLDGQPSVNADGDDLNGPLGADGNVINDEDGVRQASPFGPGAIGQFEITVTNTSGSPAYLQGFVDFNGNGNFDDPGEHFMLDRMVNSGVTNATFTIDVAVPANAAVGQTYARFRLSQTKGLGVGGFADTGEVEDHVISILPGANVANNDQVDVSRNSKANQIFPLVNDFESPGNLLRIVSLNTNGTRGSVRISGSSVDGNRSVFYTPLNNFVGRDVFGYTVEDAFGNRSSAAVEVLVTFQSNAPSAVDDSYLIAEGTGRQSLFVLNNDVPSLAGGNSIISATPGSAGGTVTIGGGGQSLLYTPRPGFKSTEQFTYSIQDAAGMSDTATVTINMNPGSFANDLVQYSLEFLDPLNGQPITNLEYNANDPSQNRFDVRVSVDDISTVDLNNPQGVASAFIDLLYDYELVSTIPASTGNGYPFEISFGRLFASGGFNQGVSQVPGLIDEIGATQSSLTPVPFPGREELFTITFEAISDGIAVFTTDPADDAQSETLLIKDDQNALRVDQIGLDSAQFRILPGPSGGVFTHAIDDAYMDGVDSEGRPIMPGSSAILKVLENDILPGGGIQEFSQLTEPRNGSLTISNNGTPGDLSDDYFVYRPNTNAAANGYDSFSYLVVTSAGIATTANVTMAYGNASADDIVQIGLSLVNAGGNAIQPSQLAVGDRFGVKVDLEDLRASGQSTFVFAGYLDMLYSAKTIRPADTNPFDGFDFDVTIGTEYNRDGAVGTASRLGVIDEFGAFSNNSNASAPFNRLNPANLATVFFDVVAPGEIYIKSSPADSRPFQDTLLYQQSEPVDYSLIRYKSLKFTPGNGAQGEAPLQNPNLRWDVNNDGQISPVDALIILNTINDLNSGGSTAAEGEALSGSILASRYFVDVNGDRKVTPLDALQIINLLSERGKGQSQSAVGEQLTVQVPALITNSDRVSANSEVSSDSVFAALPDDTGTSNIVSDASPINRSSMARVAIADADQADTDNDDELLSLLADDVARNWG